MVFVERHDLTCNQLIHDILLASKPAKQFVTSEQVAALVVFLCSGDADRITGTSTTR